MSRTGKYIHASTHTGLSIPLTNAYVAGAQRHLVNLYADSPGTVGNSKGIARLSALYVHVNTIAAGATSLTVRLTRDAAGNEPFVGDTTATISTGITTATQGAITVRIDVDYVHTNADIYAHFRTNSGTCTVDQVELGWEE